MSTLLDVLGAWRPFTAVVVGDFMLDELVYGNADRLSPEAPVPVLHVQRTERRAGGAANVCLDLAAMRGTVWAVGVTGDDAEGGCLRGLLSGAGIDASGLTADPARPTTVKRSLIGLAQHRHPQKMFRVDYESREPLGSGAEDSLIAAFERAVRGEGGPPGGRADVVCIEDYDKGVCTARVCAAVIERCRALGVEVLVDPAAIRGYSKYRGATAVTPNRTEAALGSGVRVADDAPPEAYGEVAAGLLESAGLAAVVITLDKQGALLLERQPPGAGGAHAGAVVLPTLPRQVYDVTGAGDMVLAAMAAGRANGLGWPDAVRLANAAAGLEVEVFGVRPFPIERIHAEVIRVEGAGAAATDLPHRNKVRPLDSLAVEAAALRADGKRVVFTNGCFDIPHTGHVSLLQRAAAMGDYLIVAVNSDESVRRLGKGPGRPVNGERDRAEMLAAFGCVGAVVVFGEDTPERCIELIRPDVLVKGTEYTIDRVPGAAFVESYGGRVELLPMVEGRSTTGTIEKMTVRTGG